MTGVQAKWRISDCNIPGVIAGICLCVLPFLGFWWAVRFGDGAFALEVSPFTLGMSGFGQAFFSPLIAAVNTAVLIAIIFFGALLTVGSVLRCRSDLREFSDDLVRMSARKPVWLVLAFLVTITIAGLAMEYSLQQSGIEIALPVIMGEAVGTLTASGVVVQVPVSLSLSRPFWYAVVFAIIAAYAGLYQKRPTEGTSDTGRENEPGDAAPPAPSGDPEV